MGLERVGEVWRRMGAPRPAPVVITVGGTNGKGSTVAFLEAMLRAGGMRVGAYTSPHILRYNERARVDGAPVADATLVGAFGRVEAARVGDSSEAIPLTYFEFGTLAALDVFARSDLEVALLEVGLGGRLDAVNIIDADCAVVVTVDLDHMEYLGPDRESIGREKAGIFRAGKPAIVGETNPPQSLLEHARAVDARVEVLGRDFGWSPEVGELAWWHRDPEQSRYVAPAEGHPAGIVLHGELA
ncbi:MAG TPA: Mur ligase family protein, partial [Rhodanobacteraceae bacterium]|nr:Mur ligase family protein [Rhodanobacteraceae bacterium]